jgi:hypothetical protein
MSHRVFAHRIYRTPEGKYISVVHSADRLPQALTFNAAAFSDDENSSDCIAMVAPQPICKLPSCKVLLYLCYIST